MKLNKFRPEGKTTYQKKEWWAIDVLGWERDQEIGWVRDYSGEKINLEEFAINSDLNLVFKHVTPVMLATGFKMYWALDNGLIDASYLCGWHWVNENDTMLKSFANVSWCDSKDGKEIASILFETAVISLSKAINFKVDEEENHL